MNQLGKEYEKAAFSDGFLDGATLGLHYVATKVLGVRSSNDKKMAFDTIIDEFFNALNHYAEQWDNLYVQNTVVQLIENIYNEAIAKAINKMQPVFEEFDQRNISLKPLLKELKKG